VTDSGGTAEELAYCYEIRAEDGGVLWRRRGQKLASPFFWKNKQKAA